MRKSEFAYNDSDEKKGSHALKAFVDRPGGFYNRKTAEPFTSLNGIGYKEDPYERREDFSREDYAKLNSKIIFKNQPFNHVVRQHGTFYPNVLTFGTKQTFPEKPSP